MKSTLLVATSLFAGLGACGLLVEKAIELAEGWQQLDDKPDPSQPFQLSIALKLPESHSLESTIVSSHDHLSLEAVRELRTPEQQHVDDVMRWLAENGITDATPEDDWIYVQTTVGKAESLLNMTLCRYMFEDRQPVLRAREYSIPTSLSQAISFVHPVVNFMALRNGVMSSPPPLGVSRFSQGSAAECASHVTPGCISKLYNMTYSGNSSSIILGVAGFLEENANQQDLAEFLSVEAPPVYQAGRGVPVELVNGGQDSQAIEESGVEAALDVQYASAMGYPAHVVFYATGGRGEMLDTLGKSVTGKGNDNEPYLELIQYLLNKTDDQVPHVLSVSYADDELSVPKEYAVRVCYMMGLLAARGTSIVVASGDGGARGTRSSNCRTNDGSNREVTMATFPATCPWVTSVGAVTNTVEPPAGAGFSTGGFSQFFPRERWQDAAVEGYVKALDGHLSGYYNESMRAIPDISVVGTQFDIYHSLKRTAVQGTSASAPVFAAMIALINDARVRQGKKALGWLNGLLYSDRVRDVLQDITQGLGISCVFAGNQRPGGWPAKSGYNCLTGLGVPKDFDRFLQVLLDA